MNKKRYLFFDVLHIVATVFVIYNHTHWYLNGSGKIFHLFHIAGFNICKIAVPIFIMITGFLMLNKETTYAEILKKRIPRIYIAMLITSVIGCLYYKKNIFVFLVQSIFGAQTTVLYWLWYIYLLITLYLITPILKKMIKNFDDNDYRVFFFIFLIIPSSIYFISNFSELAFGKIRLAENVFYQFIYLTNIGYYVAGYYIMNMKIDKNLNKKVLIFNFLFFILGFFYLLVGFIIKHDIVEIFYNNIATVGMSLCTFINFKYFISDLKVNSNLSKLIILLSESSFGVYLIHVFVAEYLVRLSVVKQLLQFNSLIGHVCIVSVTYIFLSFLFVILRKIPLFRKIF